MNLKTILTTPGKGASFRGAGAHANREQARRLLVGP